MDIDWIFKPIFEIVPGVKNIKFYTHDENVIYEVAPRVENVIYIDSSALDIKRNGKVLVRMQTVSFGGLDYTDTDELNLIKVQGFFANYLKEVTEKINKLDWARYHEIRREFEKITSNFSTNKSFSSMVNKLRKK